MRKIRIALIAVVVAALSLALAACVSGTAASVSGKTYQATDLTASWASDATAAQKATIVQMVKSMMVTEVADSITEANAPAKLAEITKAGMLEMEIKFAFKTDGSVKLSIEGEDAGQALTYTQSGSTVTVTGPGEEEGETKTMNFKVIGDTLRVSYTEAMGAGEENPFAGLNMVMIMTPVA